MQLGDGVAHRQGYSKSRSQRKCSSKQHVTQAASHTCLAHKGLWSGSEAPRYSRCPFSAHLHQSHAPFTEDAHPKWRYAARRADEAHLEASIAQTATHGRKVPPRGAGTSPSSA